MKLNLTETTVYGFMKLPEKLILFQYELLHSSGYQKYSWFGGILNVWS